MTKRDRDVLEFVKNYMVENGVAPTITEIGEGVNLYSRATIYKHIQNLVLCGEITPVAKKSKRYTVKGMRYVRDE